MNRGNFIQVHHGQSTNRVIRDELCPLQKIRIFLGRVFLYLLSLLTNYSLCMMTCHENCLYNFLNYYYYYYSVIIITIIIIINTLNKQ